MAAVALALCGECPPACGAEQPPPPPRFDTDYVPPPVHAGPASHPPYAQGSGGTVAAPQFGPPPAGAYAPAPGVPFAPPPAGGWAGAEQPRRLPAAGPPDSPAAWSSAQPGRPPAAGPLVATPAVPPAAPPPEVFGPGQIIAWVGNQPIQSGDIMPTIEQMLAPALAKLTPEQIEAAREEIEQQKQKLLQQALGGAVETKLLYLEFLRSLPADKQKEILPNITKRAGEQFDEKQLAEAMEKAQVNSVIELDAALRKYGSSLAEQKRLYVERILGQSVLGQKVDYQPEVTHQEMLDYYRDKAAEFERPARARWEILSVRFDRFASKAEAWAALGEMGNEVLRGAPLSAVARRHSQGPNAEEGGYCDWTTRGSLASTTLDQAIFTLPPGRLSDRLEDERGFHIIRVIEREEAGSVPFREAQVAIKETIRRQKIRQQITDYVTKLRGEITVWTVFDESAPQTAAKPPAPSGNAAWPSTQR